MTRASWPHHQEDRHQEHHHDHLTLRPRQAPAIQSPADHAPVSRWVKTLIITTSPIVHCHYHAKKRPQNKIYIYQYHFVPFKDFTCIHFKLDKALHLIMVCNKAKWFLKACQNLWKNHAVLFFPWLELIRRLVKQWMSPQLIHKVIRSNPRYVTIITARLGDRLPQTRLIELHRWN